MCEQLPVPKCKGGAQRPLERGPDAVEHRRLPGVHQPQKPSIVVEQDPHAVGLAHQRHGHDLIISHGRPLALSVAEHPGGAVGAHTVLPGRQRLGHTQAELLRLLDRYLPVVSSAADLLIAQHNGPVPETLGVVLNLAGVQAKHPINDPRVLLEEVKAAVGCSLVQFELETYGGQEDLLFIYSVCSSKNNAEFQQGRVRISGIISKSVFKTRRTVFRL